MKNKGSRNLLANVFAFGLFSGGIIVGCGDASPDSNQNPANSNGNPSTFPSTPGFPNTGLGPSGAVPQDGGGDASVLRDGGGSAADGGDGGKDGGAPTTACGALALCCNALPGGASDPTKSACNSTVNAKDEQRCSRYKSTLEGARMCGGGTTACSDLKTCCGTLPVSLQSSCNTLAAANKNDDCATRLDQLKGQGACGGGGANDELGPKCGDLKSCCSTLPSNVQSQCAPILAQKNEQTCGQVLASVQSQGACGGSGGGSACDDLETCCDTLSPQDQAKCAEILDAGNEQTCSQVLASVRQQGVCVGGGGGCSDLKACCTTLPANVQGQCAQLVNAGDDDVCDEALASVQEQGACLSGGGGSCSDLQGCCATLPANVQGQCAQIVNAGNGQTCQQALDSVRQQGACLASGGGGGTCRDLKECCPTLPANVQGQCAQLVNAGNDTNCGQALSSVRQQGACLSTPGGGGGSSCNDLKSCCSSLPSNVQGQCGQVVTTNNAQVCMAVLTQIRNEGACVPDGGGGDAGGGGGSSMCSTLSRCCLSLPSSDPNRQGCQQTVAGGNEILCEDVLETYRYKGQCTADSPPPDGGVSTPECGALTQCCGSLEKGSPYAAACVGTASVGDPSACKVILSSLRTAGVCVEDAGGGTPGTDAGPSDPLPPADAGETGDAGVGEVPDGG